MRRKSALGVFLLSAALIAAQDKPEPHLSSRGRPAFALRIATALILSQGTDRSCVIIYPDLRYHLEKWHKSPNSAATLQLIAEGEITGEETVQLKRITEDPEVAKLPSTAMVKSGTSFSRLMEVYASIPRKDHVQYVAAVGTDTSPLNEAVIPFTVLLDSISARTSGSMMKIRANDCQEPRTANPLPTK